MTPDPDTEPPPGDAGPVRVELLWAPGCPNLAATRQMLAGCLAELGLNIPVSERTGRYRSPTILVNGIDVMNPATSTQVDGDACRLDLPSRDRVLAALNASLTGCGRPLTLDSLRDAARRGTIARVATLPAPVRALHRYVLRAFLTAGRAPAPAELQSIANGIGVNLTDGLHRLAELDLVHRGGNGQILVAYPFSGTPTGHRVRLPDSPALDAMCAIDALGIPLMAGRDAMITSTDLATQQVIRVQRRDDRWQWEPGTTVVLLARTTGCGTAAECLCPSITFHLDRDHEQK